MITSRSSDLIILKHYRFIQKRNSDDDQESKTNREGKEFELIFILDFSDFPREIPYNVDEESNV